MPVFDRFARPFDAFLFDMDGTILTSIPAVIRAWTAWANRVGVDVDAVMHYLHGRPARDTISHFAPAGTDVAEEVAWLDAREFEDLDGIAPIPGAIDLLNRLPRNRWAVVTSANRALATVRIKAAGLPLPDLLISSDDVTHGKPNPEGFAKAARLLGFASENCLVFEDTIAGLEAGTGSGAQVMRIAGVADAMPEMIAPWITDYTSLQIDVLSDGLAIGGRFNTLP